MVVDAIGPLEIEQLYVVVYTAAMVLFALAGFFVYRDASARGNERAWQWGLGTYASLSLFVLPGIVFLAVYWHRRAQDSRVESPDEVA